MKRHKILTTRRELIKGLGSISGALLAGCSDNWPPTYGNLLRMSDNLTYRAQRLLVPAHALAREYDHHDISSFPAIRTVNPGDPTQRSYNVRYGEQFDRLRANGFADWRLTVEGSVASPGTFSLEQLKRMPARTQITKHTCEEGWTAIAQWTGVPLSRVLEAVGMRPSARWVNFFAYDTAADSIDLLDALHPQTLLAYGMNGADLPLAHGAPVRLRVETQLGYKSLKYLRRIVVTDTFNDFGVGPLRGGWSWYAGI